MGLFKRIKDAIFGHPAAATPMPGAGKPFNIVAVLTAMAQNQSQKLIENGGQLQASFH